MGSRQDCWGWSVTIISYNPVDSDSDSEARARARSFLGHPPLFLRPSILVPRAIPIIPNVLVSNYLLRACVVPNPSSCETKQNNASFKARVNNMRKHDANGLGWAAGLGPLIHRSSIQVVGGQGFSPSLNTDGAATNYLVDIVEQSLKCSLSLSLSLPSL
jgi:hypothetical protein